MAITQRRTFLKSTGWGALALGMRATQSRAQSRAERIVVGVIGTGGMGSQHTAELAARNDVEVAYVCDVDQQRLQTAAERVESATGRAPRPVDDLRHVLDDPRVDAVYIATPDHWHAPASILALDAGKHVYVEKPCCHNIREGRLMMQAVERSGKVLQVGTQSRSAPILQEAIQRIRAGEIGDVLVTKAWNSQRRRSIGHVKPSDPPAGLNFDLWLGPAPVVPYRSNLLPAIWRWWYDFGCGDIGNDGVHDLDVALWGFDVPIHPTRIACLGGKYFFDDDQQFPDTQYAVFEYPVGDAPDGRCRQLIFEQRIWSPYVQEGYENGVAFYGTKGYLLVGHSVGWRLYGERDRLIAESSRPLTLTPHYDNFFAAIRDGQVQPNADVLAGHRAATLVHLANIAARVGRVLHFDPETEQILNDADANQLVRRRYRANHWAVPQDV